MGRNTIYVLFWFDTEDFVNPEGDDAVKRLAEILEKHGVRGTFKFVGEKLRILKKRGRRDVMSALAKHDVGYHSNQHSCHTVVSEYMKEMSWEDGAAEFIRREWIGVRDLERVYGTKPSCYGQPGGAWAPQVYSALKDWGIPVYLGESAYIGLEEQPFWYCRTLTISRMGNNFMELGFELGRPGHLEESCERFRKIYERLHEKGGGLVSIANHPTQLVTTEFYDALNFKQGKNPPFKDPKAELLTDE